MKLLTAQAILLKQLLAAGNDSRPDGDARDIYALSGKPLRAPLLTWLETV